MCLYCRLRLRCISGNLPYLNMSYLRLFTLLLVVAAVLAADDAESAVGAARRAARREQARLRRLQDTQADDTLRLAARRAQYAARRTEETAERRRVREASRRTEETDDEASARMSERRARRSQGSNAHGYGERSPPHSPPYGEHSPPPTPTPPPAATWQPSMTGHYAEVAAAWAEAGSHASLPSQRCASCQERWPGMVLTPRSRRCKRCNSERPPRGAPRRFSAENNAVPRHLEELPMSLDGRTRLEMLTPIEEMCIARVSTHVAVLRLAGGQTGFHGHVVNFLRDVQAFAELLPIRPEELDMLVVRREGVNRAGEAVHRDWTVRPHVLRRWLEYLRANNPYYSDIRLNEPELRRLERDRDRQAPAGGPAGTVDRSVSILGRLRTVETPEDGREHAAGPRDAGAAGGVGNAAAAAAAATGGQQRVTSGCSAADTSGAGATELDMLQRALQQQRQRQQQGPVAFGEVDRRNPIREGAMAGMVSCAFPMLFPDGMDPLSPRQRALDEHEYYRHIIRLGGRFARHERFT